MSTKAEWAELFESVHGRKPSPKNFWMLKQLTLIQVLWLLKQHL